MKSVAAVTAVLPATVQAVPLLEIRRSGSSVELKWPAAETGWGLQTTASLIQGPWSNVTQSPTVVGSSNVLLQSIQTTPRYFRLVCNGTDLPDNGFNDTNCDGIDGDAAQAIFVVTSGGSDLNPGTRNLPMATLSAAITRAAAQDKDVYAGKGTYNIPTLLNLRNGVSLYGQYDPADNWSRAATNLTTISGGRNVIVGQGIAAETHVEGFTIQAGNATVAGTSSHAVQLHSSSGPVVLRYNRIEAGFGAAGSTFTTLPAAPGGDGVDGVNGSPDDDSATVPGGLGGPSPSGNTGGRGGNGGNDSSAFKGGAGMAAALGGAGGGPGGNGGNPGSAGGNGTAGANGAKGNDGIGGDAFASVTGLEYSGANGTGGTNGLAGKGGGGGGGGGGQTCPFCFEGTGNAGGGGGGGGNGGDGGGGGMGGGGSFGVLVTNSSAMVTGNIIITKGGGNGGKGGDGGLGGDGGEGGDGGIASLSEIGRGGNGGHGGRGGHGGNGGGGGGGPSIGIVNSGGTVTNSGNTFTLGLAGTGGAGGTNPDGTGPAGSDGLRTNYHAP